MTSEIQYPGPYDILCSKTADAYTHKGNYVFRKLIESYSSSYAKAGQRKVLKSQVVNEIIRAVLANGGQFLQQSGSSWTVMKKSKRREKISNALRRATTVVDRIKQESNHTKDDVPASTPQHVSSSLPENLSNFLNDNTEIRETATTDDNDMDPLHPIDIDDLSTDEYDGLAEMIESSILDPSTNDCLMEPLANDCLEPLTSDTEEECSDEVASLLREWVEI